MSSATTKKSGRTYRGVGPDGLPRLPPIQKPKNNDDPYADSKLMSFRMAKHREGLLQKIM